MTGSVLKRLLGVAVLLASSIGTTVGAAELRQAVLVQNSGWMEPFYVDADSPFKPLVAQLPRRRLGRVRSWWARSTSPTPPIPRRSGCIADRETTRGLPRR